MTFEFDKLTKKGKKIINSQLTKPSECKTFARSKTKYHKSLKKDKKADKPEASLSHKAIWEEGYREGLKEMEKTMNEIIIEGKLQERKRIMEIIIEANKKWCDENIVSTDDLIFSIKQEINKK